MAEASTCTAQKLGAWASAPRGNPRPAMDGDSEECSRSSLFGNGQLWEPWLYLGHFGWNDTVARPQ